MQQSSKMLNTFATSHRGLYGCLHTGSSGIHTCITLSSNYEHHVGLYNAVADHTNFRQSYLLALGKHNLKCANKIIMTDNVNQCLDKRELDHNEVGTVAKSSIETRHPSANLAKRYVQVKGTSLESSNGDLTNTSVFSRYFLPNLLFSIATRSFILPRVVVRYMSTIRKNMLETNQATGETILDEQERLLSNSRGNKEITVHACGKLYTELRKTKPHLYSNSPEEGIDFKVRYYDSLDLVCNPSSTSDVSVIPTVCLLHGAPGHYKDYASLINFLTARRVRVIAPCFPDYTVTLNHGFRHSPQERRDYLIEFFKKINVTKIDLVIGHSSGAYTVFDLAETCLRMQSPEDEIPSLQIKSIGLFGTAGHHAPQNITPTPLRLFALRLTDYYIMRLMMSAFVGSLVTSFDLRTRVDAAENLYLAACTMGYSDYKSVGEKLTTIRRNKMPVIFVYGTNDRLIQVDYFHRLAKDLGITSGDQVKFYDQYGNVHKDIVDQNDSIHVSEFESGGHYAFQRYSKQVNEDVYEFLVHRVIRSQVDTTKL